jgi:dTDP-4-dehydrorhamnose 3,5-epimerase
MNIQSLRIPDVLLIRPTFYEDERGFFFEAWNQQRYNQAGIHANFVQLNHSHSKKGTLRGLHFQREHPQGKLVRVLSGKVFDVAVDLRRDQASFGQWCGAVLTAEKGEQLWLPPGFAHGFCVLSETADFEYLCTDFYDAKDEGSIFWADPDIGIEWPLKEVHLSEKDQRAPSFKSYSQR